MANQRTARTDAKPSLTALVALAAIAFSLPGGNVLAVKQSSSPGVAEIASAIVPRHPDRPGRRHLLVRGPVSRPPDGERRALRLRGSDDGPSQPALRHDGARDQPAQRQQRRGRVNDRGPFVGTRIADLSQAADGLRHDKRPPAARRHAGLALVVVALAVQPLSALMLGRPAAQLETAGLFPDPTALLTLGPLLVAGRAHWSLFPVPLMWCVVSATTLWTMDAADAALPLLSALLAAAAAVFPRSRSA